ncbi:hypothetical protein [Brevibacterium aurantiacum]|uniref:hypothetical protein n=1 Tax=Brevibacterium aurantiacum TaxID=273384 RepID=UPI003F90171A
MTAVLIRAISAATFSRVDDLAKRAGTPTPRAEYFRRTIDREASRSDEVATIDDLRKIELLTDDEHMSRAWQ